MPIHSVQIQNFKGIHEEADIPIKPITLFIGPNSSGKSSVIHSLAALSQTVVLPNNTRALILDDEFASVHLGRFIEVIHSKSYADCICLGVDIGDPTDEEKTAQKLRGRIKVNYGFKSTKRTQDIFVEHGSVTIGDTVFSIKRSKGVYNLEDSKSGKKIPIRFANGFNVSETSLFGSGDIKLFDSFIPLLFAQRAIKDELSRTFYLGPFRQSPLRRYPTRGSAPREVGPEGEATITLLANEVVQSRTRGHINEVAGWLATLGLAKKIEVTRVGRSDLFDVSATLTDGARFPLADLGYGLSQVLPVLTQLSFAPKGATLLFEQPELHLHPLAQRPLATVFIEAIERHNVHIVAETHSRELVGEFQRKIRDKKISLDKFAAYRVSRDGGRSKFIKVNIENDGEIYQSWEKGFSSEI